MRALGRGVVWILALAAALLAVLALRAYLFPPSPAFGAGGATPTPTREAPGTRTLPAVDIDAAATRLAAAVRWRTIADADDPDANRDQFDGLHALLAQAYPRAHAALQRERIGPTALLYTWRGRDPGRAPFLLLAHQDVVPAVVDGAERKWQADPFGGEIRDGFVWGRGTLDDKSSIIAMLEAVESLVTAGFEPAATVYLAFGGDEEVGGQRGAKAIADDLARRGVRLGFVLDEGMLIVDRALKGLDRPAALIGIAEKGLVTLSLTADAAGGHSSMPPSTTAIGRLSEAIVRLQRSPLPASVDGVARQMFESLAPAMQPVERILLSNLWLTAPVVTRVLSAAPASNAMIRTTQAPTVLRAGQALNVLPDRAQAWVNYRILPGEQVAGVRDHVVAAIADPSIAVTIDGPSQDPSPISSTRTKAFGAIAAAIAELQPQAVIAPGLVIVATDSRHLQPISDDVYRFQPIRIDAADLKRLHGIDERISLDNLSMMIGFYQRLVTRAAR